MKFQLNIFLLMTVLSLSKVQCRVEENGRILVYDDFEDYKVIYWVFIVERHLTFYLFIQGENG